MFWSLANFGSQQIDAILDRDGGFTLEELLEEDELLQECKAQNARLVEFLTLPETMASLVRYVTEMPAPADSEARRFKYPFVASEVLACDAPAVRDALLGSRPLLRALLRLLQLPPPLPPVLAGYVSKILTSAQKQGPEAFKRLFDDVFDESDGGGGDSGGGDLSVDALLPQLMVHIGSDAILQLLITLCIGEPAPTEPGAPAALATPRDELAASSWLPHSQLVPAALDALADPDPEVAANASALLCGLLTASAEPPACLEDGDAGVLRCAALVRVCVGHEVGDPPNLPAFDVVLQLLAKLRESPSSSPCLDSLLSAVEADIERFFACLAAPAPLPQRIARFLPPDALPYRPRGQQRCKLLMLLEECLKSERPALVTPLLELGLFPITCDMLLLPHSCNALHMRASAILEWGLTVCNEALGPSIRTALFDEAMLTQRVLELVEEYRPATKPAGAPAADGAAPQGEAAGADEAPTLPARPRKTLPCCHAFVMHIGACMLTAAQRDPEVRACLEACDGWERFIAPGGALTTWEAVQQRPLGGLAPTRIDDDSDEDDELDAATMERVLAAQAAANANREEDRIQDDDEDDEGGSGSEYLQHFAQYLDRNFLNQTSENVNDLVAMGEQLPPPPTTDAWTAEFDDFDIGGPDGAPATSGSEGGSAAATGGLIAFDDDDDMSEGGESRSGGGSGTGGGGGGTGSATGGGTGGGGAPTTIGSSAGGAETWATELETPSSSAGSADGDLDDGWAAFDPPQQPTGPGAGGGGTSGGETDGTRAAAGSDEPGADASGTDGAGGASRLSENDSGLAI